MKIDLHCHTQAIRRGEIASRNATKELFCEKTAVANVKIVAITNHDIFDRHEFEEFQSEAGDACNLWPGIEFNVVHDDEKYHMIVVGSPSDLDAFESAVLRVTSGKSGEFDVTLNEVLDSFSELDVLFLPHFGNKSPAISMQKLADLHKKVPNRDRVILEDSNSTSTAVLSSHGFRTITGSDVQDWSKYQNSDLSELRIPVDTFEQFCMFLDRDPVVIKTLLDKSLYKIYQGQPSKEDESVKVSIPLYREVNVIFGDKGTGKSQIIESVRKKMEADGLSVANYVSSQKDERIKSLLDSSSMLRSAEKLGYDDCADEFELIAEWGDTDIELLQTYRRHADTKEKAGNKDRIKITDQQVLPYDNDILDTVGEDLDYAAHAIDDIDSIEGEYIDSSEQEEISNRLEGLRKAIGKKRVKEVVEKYSNQLMIFTTRRIGAIVSSNTGIVSKPASSGFYEYAKNRLALHRATDKILANLSAKQHKERVFFGSIGDKGELFIESSWKMYDAASRYDEYTGSPNISTIKDALASIRRVRKYAFSDEPEICLDEYRKFYDEGCVDTTSSFVGVKKYIVDNDYDPYDPSNGERAIVMIQRDLSEDKDAYLLDEPELSLGGAYIDKEIRPRITALGKSGKTVLIATHNANIAVRTLPYNTIFRQHSKEGYKTYLGNPFTNKLVRSDGEELDWKVISMEVLEGGEEAFTERGEIYEAGGTPT